MFKYSFFGKTIVMATAFIHRPCSNTPNISIICICIIFICVIIWRKNDVQEKVPWSQTFPPPLHYLYFCQIRRPKDILFVRTNRNSSYQITHSTNLSEQILIRVVRTNILFVQTNRNSSKQITDSSEQIATCIVRKKSKFVQTNKIFFIWPFHAAV